MSEPRYRWPLVVRVDQGGAIGEWREVPRPFDDEAALAFSVDYEDGPPTIRDLGVHDRGRRA